MVRRKLRLLERDPRGDRNGPREAAVPAEVVDEVADRIADLARRTELEFAYDVGRVVAERFYSGDPAAWHRPGPKREALGRLAERLQTRGAGSASALHVCLGVYETLAPLGDISTWKRLTRSHVRAVLPLPAPDRASLLREAEVNRWTVAQLEAVAEERPRERKLGRPRTPAFVRAIAAAERVFDPGGPAFRELERSAGMDVETVRDLHARLVRLRGRIESLQARLSPKRLMAARSLGDDSTGARRREA